MASIQPPDFQGNSYNSSKSYADNVTIYNAIYCEMGSLPSQDPGRKAASNMLDHIIQDSSLVRTIANRLRFFRYIDGSNSRHANIPDELQLLLKYSPAFLQALEIKDANELVKLRQQSHNTKNVLGWIKVFGEITAVGIERNDCLSLILGTSWSVTEEDIEKAVRIEKHLAPFSHLIIDPPDDSSRCLCPKYYPDRFT